MVLLVLSARAHACLGSRGMPAASQPTICSLFLVFCAWQRWQLDRRFPISNGAPPSLIAIQWSTSVAGRFLPNGKQYSHNGCIASLSLRNRCHLADLYIFACFPIYFSSTISNHQNHQNHYFPHKHDRACACVRVRVIRGNKTDGFNG